MICFPQTQTRYGMVLSFMMFEDEGGGEHNICKSLAEVAKSMHTILNSDKIEVVMVAVSDSIAKKIVVYSLETESNATVPVAKFLSMMF
jgi:hypothetical protein